MKNQFSEYSMLRCPMPRDELMLSSIIDTTQRNVRAMSRVMQVYSQNACGNLDNLEKDYEDLQEIFDAFYTYVDSQMDLLSELSEELECDLSWVSLKKLRASADFQRQPIPRAAFASDEDYRAHLSQFDARTLSELNETFGEAVAPAKTRQEAAQ